jgi:hypothetical protein
MEWYKRPIWHTAPITSTIENAGVADFSFETLSHASMQQPCQDDFLIKKHAGRVI